MKASRGEIKIEEILQNNYLNYKMEYQFPHLVSNNGRPLRFDFVIFDDDNNVDFIIEYQGRQHYESVGKYGGEKGFINQQINDDKKRRYCAMNNYKLIEIPYTEYDNISYEYIMERAGY